MAGEAWQQTKVDEMIRRGVLALNDGYRVRNVELGPVGIPFVRGGDIGDGGINTAVEDHIRPEFTDRVQSKLTRPFDVAFITKGTVGRVGMVRPGQPPSVFAPQVCYWRSLDPDQLEPRFLFYLLTSAEFQANLDAVKTHGSMAADYVSMTDQRDFRLTFPPIREQKAIAAVLGTLDDKIELNRRMNATLEEMARALFQSWFVDFDPVRAKLDGRPPAALNAATAAIFPATAALFLDSIQDSPIGHIPHGWKAGKLGEFMQVGIGGAWGEETPSSTANVEVRCLRGIDCHDLAERKLPEVPIRHLSKRQLADRRLMEGCILVEGSGSFCGRSMVWLSEFGRLVGDSVCYSNFCKRLDPLCSPSQALVCWMQLRAANDTGELANFRTGTAFPNFDIHGALLGLDVVCPPEEICDRYMELYRSWLRLDLVEESRTLATLRDTLLPKLLSGELSVTEVEKEIPA